MEEIKKSEKKLLPLNPPGAEDWFRRHWPRGSRQAWFKWLMHGWKNKQYRYLAESQSNQERSALRNKCSEGDESGDDRSPSQQEFN